MKPNVLLITGDQMRVDCLSDLDHPVVETPHLVLHVEINSIIQLN